MGLGSFSFDVDWDAETWNELAATTTLVLFEGERLIYGGTITKPTPGRDGINLSGRSLEYALGLDAIAPTVEDRWYVSGKNCLANPVFAAGLVHWSTNGVGIWYLDTASPGHVATRAAGFNDPTGLTAIAYNIDDQPFASDQQLEVAPGYGFVSTIDCVRDPTENVGRLRLRHIYTGGTFAHPDLCLPYSSWSHATRGDIHFETDPQGIVVGPVLRIQTALPNLIPNGSFDDAGGSLDGIITFGLGQWFLGSDGGHNGAHYMFTDTSSSPNPNSSPKYVASTQTGGVVGPPVGLPVKPFEEYRAWAVIRGNPAFTDTDGQAYVSVGINAPGGTTYAETAPQNTGDNEWKLQLVDFTIPDDGTTDVVLRLQVTNHVHGQWDFDDITLIRTAGNYDYVTHPALPGVSGRTYRWTVPYRSDPGITDGSVQLNMVCYSFGGQDTLVIQGLPLAPTENALQSASWDFTMPPGFDFFSPQVAVQDLHGGAFFVGRGTIVDTDNKSVVVEALTPIHEPTPITAVVASTPPAGAKLCQFVIVAEPYALGWRVSNASTRRVGATYATGEDIVFDLCTHPQTGLPTLQPGLLRPSGVIETDWHVLNMGERAMLSHLSTGGLVLPYREWRTNPDASLDWGLPEDIFADHPDIVLGPDDFFLLGQIQAVGSNNEDAVTDVKLIGASYTTLDGTTVQIIGRATNPPGTARDHWGNPIRRMQVASNTAIDIPSAADLNADYLASRAQPAIRTTGKAGGGTAGVRLLDGHVRTLRSGQPMAVGASPAITVELADPRVLGPIVPGDWIYLWDGVRLEDSAYELPLPDGRLVHPVQKRILSMLSKYAGGAVRAFLHRPDGTLYPDDPRGLPVKWEGATTTTLELGELLTEFAVAPEGGDAAAQLLRFLTSTPAR